MEIVKVDNNEIKINEEVVEKLLKFEEQKMEINKIEKKLKEQLLEKMEEHNVLKIDLDVLSISYKKPHERTTIDSKKLKEEQPEIAEKYSKTSQVKSSVSISIK